MSLHQVSLSRVVAQPWKNGGGITHELLTWPPQQAWRVRVSVATIAADGPFSAFDGIERWFAVLEGGGVRLTHTGLTVDCLAGSEPWQFDGADAPGCTLLAGATRDLNLMLRGKGRMQRLSASAQLAGGVPWRALFTWAPCTLHAEGQAHALPAGTLVWSDDESAGPWFCDASHGAAFWLSLREH